MNKTVTQVYNDTQTTTVTGAVTRTYSATLTESVSGAVKETYGNQTTNGGSFVKITAGVINLN